MVDSTDRIIIKCLEKNARTSFAELGRMVSLTPSSVRERVKRLEDSGVIRKYTIEVDSAQLGFGMEAFIVVKLRSGTLKSFTSLIDTWDEIQEAYRITGEHNIQMRVVLKDQLHLQSFIDEMLKYGDPTTSLILSKVKA